MDISERYLAKQKELANKGINPPFPRILKIDTCNVCNYNCVFCPQSKQINKCGCIDKELCLGILEDAYKAGAREVCLSSTGEPLLNPDLELYIDTARKIGYTYIFFNTNGYLMDCQRAERIIVGADSIKFSINADKKSYELVHGVDGFERVIKNLKYLYEKRNRLETKCRIYVSYVAIKQTADEARELEQKVKDICDGFMVMNANNRAGSISEVDSGLYNGDDQYTYSFPCSQIFNNIYVTAEGYMTACGQDFENQLVMADLHEENIAEAWNNESFTKFRRQYLDKDLEGTLCYNCLNNTNNPVIPWNEKFSGYEESSKKKENLDKRIRNWLNRE